MDISDEEFEEGRIRLRLSEALKFWTACPTKACRRARACMDDPNRCYAIFWPVVPQVFKVQWQAFLDAKSAGRSARQAERAADAAVAEWRMRERAMARLAK